MSRKVVAIGDGENGRKRSDGTRYPCELTNQDKEIIRLTDKKRLTEKRSALVVKNKNPRKFAELD